MRKPSSSASARTPTAKPSAKPAAIETSSAKRRLGELLRVGIVAAVERVAAGVAGDDVVQRVARAIDSCAAGQGQVLYVVAQGVGDARLHGVHAFAGVLRHHIAGSINPASKNKRSYWTGPAPVVDSDAWLSEAVEKPYSKPRNSPLPHLGLKAVKLTRYLLVRDQSFRQVSTLLVYPKAR